MFRALARKKKQIPDGDAIALLRQEKRGVLAVNGDDGYPYGMPMNHFYNPEDGCIYFHCGRTGHRIDSLKRTDRFPSAFVSRGLGMRGTGPTMCAVSSFSAEWKLLMIWRKLCVLCGSCAISLHRMKILSKMRLINMPEQPCF